MQDFRAVKCEILAIIDCTLIVVFDNMSSLTPSPLPITRGNFIQHLIIFHLAITLLSFVLASHAGNAAYIYGEIWSQLIWNDKRGGNGLKNYVE